MSYPDILPLTSQNYLYVTVCNALNFLKVLLLSFYDTVWKNNFSFQLKIEVFLFHYLFFRNVLQKSLFLAAL